MSTGPLRRATGTLGLLVLVPIMVQFATGGIPAEVAAARAVAVAIATVLIGKVLSSVVRSTLRRFEAAEAAAGAGAAATVGAEPTSGSAISTG